MSVTCLGYGIAPTGSWTPQVIREAYGALLPDKRRSRTELAAEYGDRVDLSNIVEDDQQ
jgi:hypothetical protein